MAFGEGNNLPENKGRGQLREERRKKKRKCSGNEHPGMLAGVFEKGFFRCFGWKIKITGKRR